MRSWKVGSYTCSCTRDQRLRARVLLVALLVVDASAASGESDPSPPVSLMSASPPSPFASERDMLRDTLCPSLSRVLARPLTDTGDGDGDLLPGATAPPLATVSGRTVEPVGLRGGLCATPG
mmetsp:Transcript_297/g.914  ORF Transcript_297/g.914 Transcript_297/m.914 type:complete len:122 (+) Transcript_297:973-1338(+)